MGSLEHPPRPGLVERTRLRRAVDAFPCSLRGVLLAGFAGLALWRYGFGSLDLVVFSLGIAGLSLLALSVGIVGVSALYLQRRLPLRAGPSGVVSCGAPLRTDLALPSLERVPLVQLRWQWLAPAGVECRARNIEGELVEEVVTLRRCHAARIVRRFELRDAFGLARVAFERVYATSLVVLPDPGRLRDVQLVRSFSRSDGLPHPAGAPEGDRMEIRRYAHGDSARDILWKTYARTRQLNVRLRERSVDLSQRTVAYLVAGRGDEPAAAAARVALESGRLGRDWRFGADGSDEPCHKLDAALEAIARSGNPDVRGAGLGRFLARIAGEGDSDCVVFVPGRPGDWLAPLASAVRGYRGGLSFVVGVDGESARAKPRPAWQRALLRDDGLRARARVSLELAAVVAELARTGRPAVIADRATGRTQPALRPRAPRTA